MDIDTSGLKIGKYTLIQKLGSGGFSSVYLCEDENHNQFALKKIRDVKERYVKQELNALMSIKSPFIVKFVEHFVYKEYPIIIMEYCEQGTLDTYIKQFEGGILPEEKALQIFAAILNGFRTIHESGFIHRDLKTSNILMKDGQVKISDFGLSMKASSTQMVQSKSCTPSYAAPEVLLGQQQGYKVDIWSLGCILYKMIYGCLPFDGQSNSKLLKKIDALCSNVFQISKAPKKKLQDISVGLIKLLRDIFVIDYKKRIGFKDLYQYEVIQKHFKNLQESLNFYEEIEKKDEVEMLQSQANKYNGFDNFQSDTNIEEEQKRQASLEREDAMVTSILLQQKVDNSQEQLLKNYTACINQYAFLIDNYIFFNQKINSIFDVLNSSNLLLLKFFLSKLILYYIEGLKKILLEKDNVFELQVNWAQFTASKTYKQLQDRVKTDYMIWRDEFERMYSQVKQIKEEKYPSLQQYFNDEYTVDENYYEKLPDNIKLPFRAVIMTNLKMFFLSLKDENNINFKTKTQKQSTVNPKGQKGQNQTKNEPNKYDLNEPPKILMMPHKFIILEKNCRATVFLRLGLCAAWNRIFSAKNVFNFNNNKISYDQLIKIIHESDYDQCQKQTLKIMDVYFSNLKDFNYNFI